MISRFITPVETAAPTKSSRVFVSLLEVPFLVRGNHQALRRRSSGTTLTIYEESIRQSQIETLSFC
jgi:hypothetical protein